MGKRIEWQRKKKKPTKRIKTITKVTKNKGCEKKHKAYILTE